MEEAEETAAFHMVTPLVRAAGGIVVRPGERGRPEVVLVHRPRYGDWSFPKGKLLPGETYRDGAVREVEEETGLRCELDRELAPIRYTDPQGRPKEVRYWTMHPGEQGPWLPSDEVDEVRWVDAERALDLLSYPHDRDLLRDVLEADRPQGPETSTDSTTVLLVRHGRAGDRSAWTGPDHLRPLSERGWRQAESLVDLLADHPIDRMLSSPAVRCVQTVEPLAKHRDLPIERVEWLMEGAGNEGVLEYLKEVTGGGAVLCTHGDVLLDTLHSLGMQGVVLEGGLRCQKGSVWALEVRGGGVTRARYLPPPV